MFRWEECRAYRENKYMLPTLSYNRTDLFGDALCLSGSSPVLSRLQTMSPPRTLTDLGPRRLDIRSYSIVS